MKLAAITKTTIVASALLFVINGFANEEADYKVSGIETFDGKQLSLPEVISAKTLDINVSLTSIKNSSNNLRKGSIPTADFINELNRSVRRNTNPDAKELNLIFSVTNELNTRYTISYTCSVDEALLAGYRYRLQKRPIPFSYKNGARTLSFFMLAALGVVCLLYPWYLIGQAGRALGHR